MDSLSHGLVADVLERLHREAEAADAPLMQAYAHEAVDVERTVSKFVEAETTDMAGLYHGLAGNFLSVSRDFGRFLYMCARTCKAARIVEFGSSMGISAIYMAAALRDMGGGRLIGTDLEPGKVERARANVAAAGLDDLVEFRLGDARETLKPGVGGCIDMVMLDGAFTLYLPILKLLEPHLKPGAVVVGENAFEQGSGYLDYVRDPQNGYRSLPLPFDPGRGNELTIRTA
ncbi:MULTISPECIES: class I SAM-dependent methyltransferase [Bradyrhizobium]|uniref:O-methyltransferase n=1 Tax=Bradyrhizobium TaxID=374 RepID=UPI00040BAB9D|nr:MULTISPECIES: class I SAM-dependent methyltransferase [Bradyrhizobium]AUC99844.1 methyltransferase [Bradyrhizobium sp. SK17]KIU43567.1 methyltransferase [Bradyrhizobium elkanii]MBK5655717.1 class I SAM-dependent methyltransferase [Rhizobium sp.]OCX31287.1 methyltransferase [Bradyrhizobium sp. UASWS1016]